MQETWETQVQTLSQEDALAKEIETHSSIIAWRIPRTEEPGRLQATGSESDTTEVTHVYTYSCNVVISFGCTPKGISYTQPLFFWISSPFRSPQMDEESRLCVQEAFSSIYFIHSSVYMSMPTSQLTASVPSWYPHICSPCLCLYFCFANKFICTIFLHSTHKQYYVFLFLTYFTLCDRLKVHPRLCKWHRFVLFYD